MVSKGDAWTGGLLHNVDGWAEVWWAMQMDGPVVGCPMETGGPVHGCPVQMGGPRNGEQRRRMGRWKVSKGDGWASELLHNVDGWAEVWWAMQMDRPVVGRRMETGGPVHGCPVQMHQENVILLFLVLFTNSATMYTIWI